MKNLKLILPMLAFVLAIGMSFAFTSEAPGDLVIEIDGQLYESPINCNGAGQSCTTWITKEGDVRQVQVKREISPGNYELEVTAMPDPTVFDISSLTPINP